MCWAEENSNGTLTGSTGTTGGEHEQNSGLSGEQAQGVITVKLRPFVQK